MPSNSASSDDDAPRFAAERTYLLKLHDCTPLSGAVEHLLSGQTNAFASPAELLAALARPCTTTSTTQEKKP